MNKVFIVGAPRSGTTWLQLLLSQSDRISTAQETHLFSEYLKSFSASWKAHSSDSRAIGLQNIYTWTEFLELKKKITEDVFTRILNKKESADIVLEKTPDHVFYWREILELYPDAYFIHLIRDPRAVVASMRATGAQWRNPWAVAGIADLSRAWTSAISEGRKVSDATPHARAIHYEEIVRNGPELLNDLWSWLGAPETLEVAQRAIMTCSFDHLVGGEGAPKFQPWDVGKEPKAMWRKGISGSWKVELSTGDVAIIESICGSLMEDFGYQISTNRKVPVSYQLYSAAEFLARSAEKKVRAMFRSYRNRL